jgi:hypothetical protein
MKSKQGCVDEMEGIRVDEMEGIRVEIARRASRAQAMAALLPCMWRRAKYTVVGLQKAEQYNGMQCIVLGVKTQSDSAQESRLMTRLMNADANELLLKRSNLELVEAGLSSEQEPQLSCALERLALCCSPDVPRTKEGIGAAARNLVQGILDVTFPIESNLVDAEFNDTHLFFDILDILACIETLCCVLSSALLKDGSSVVGQGGGDNSCSSGAAVSDESSAQGGEEVLRRSTQVMIEWLGEGLAECVHWRRGALIYMLTATRAADKKSVDLASLDEGLRQLDLMVATRSTRLAKGIEDAEGADGVRDMISAGILSDTHLLAVVYSGEMCFWAVEAHKEGRVDGDRSAGESQCIAVPRYAVRGQGYLKRYIKAVETMSAGSVGYGWDTDRAKLLLVSLQNSTI